MSYEKETYLCLWHKWRCCVAVRCSVVQCKVVCHSLMYIYSIDGAMSRRCRRFVAVCVAVCFMAVPKLRHMCDMTPIEFVILKLTGYTHTHTRTYTHTH